MKIWTMLFRRFNWIETMLRKCYWLCIVIFVILIFCLYIVGIIFSSDIDNNLNIYYYQEEGMHNYHVFATFFHMSWYFEGILTSFIILVIVVILAILGVYGLAKLIQKAKQQDEEFEFVKKWPFNAWPLNLLPCFEQKKN